MQVNNGRVERQRSDGVFNEPNEHLLLYDRMVFRRILKFHIKYLEVQAKCFKQHQQVQVMKDQYPEESLTELLSISLHEVE